MMRQILLFSLGLVMLSQAISLDNLSRTRRDTGSVVGALFRSRPKAADYPLIRITKNLIVKRKAANGTEEYHMLITALTSDPANKTKSAIQCWELYKPFIVSKESGISGSLSFAYDQGAEQARYSELPAGYVGTLHAAPIEQFVITLKGLVNVYIDEEDRTDQNEMYIEPGSNGLIIAADTTTEGHVSVYAKNETTITIQLPMKGGVKGLGGHKVLHAGACNMYDR